MTASNSRNEREAAEHEQLRAAKEAYTDSRRVYSLLLAKRFKTADGVPFDLSENYDFYYLVDRIDSKPRLHKVTFWSRYIGIEYPEDTDFSADYDEDGRWSLKIIADRSPWDVECKGGYKYDLSSLYSDRDKAKAALKKLSWNGSIECGWKSSVKNNRTLATGH